MTIGARNISANDDLLYRRVDGASLPAWAWRELHTAKTSSGDSRSAILLINDGAESVAMMTQADLERLLSEAYREGASRE